jgi:hypothetical protein
VLEVLGSDALRVSIADRVAKTSATLPPEVVPDLIAAALAQRNIDKAIQLLEDKKNDGVLGADDTFLLAYLYCMNGNVDKAESFVAANAAAIKNNSFAGWVWDKLRSDFGFHPPAN